MPSMMMDSKGYTSYQQILELEQTKRIQREKLTLFQKPFLTLCIFSIASYTYIKMVLKYLLLHPLMIYFLIPIVFLWIVTETFPGPHTQIINVFEFYIEFIVWWVGLGILSSIGFGSGLQTGLLFLFPHILRVSLAAQTCKTLDFESDTNIWFRSPKSLFQCPPLTLHSTPVTFYGIWCKIIGVCFLQAAGTAIGEIPPYWITRAARLASNEADAGTKKLTDKIQNSTSNNKVSNKNSHKKKSKVSTLNNNNNGSNNTISNNNDSVVTRNDNNINHRNNNNNNINSSSAINITHEIDNNTTTSATTNNNTSNNNNNNNNAEMPEELAESSSTGWSVYSQLKSLMIRFLQKYGFYGVLVMASFPNIAFDICGVYCGHYLMPFWTFFGATFIGKVLIRNTYQSFIYVALCSEKYLEMLIQLLQYLSPDSLQCDKIIRQVLEESRASFHRDIIAAVAASSGGVAVVEGGSSTGSSANINKTPVTSASSSSSSYANIVFFYWQLFMFIILLSFLLSCVSHFAQYHQLMIDTEEIKKLKNELGLTTPTQSPMHPINNGNNSNSNSSNVYNNVYNSNSKMRHSTHIINSPTIIASRNHIKNSNLKSINDDNDKSHKSNPKKLGNSNNINSSSRVGISLFSSPLSNNNNNNNTNNNNSISSSSSNNNQRNDDDDDDNDKYDHHNKHKQQQYRGYSTSIANSGINILTSATVIHNSLNNIGTLSSQALNTLTNNLSGNLSQEAQPKQQQQRSYPQPHPQQSSSSNSSSSNNIEMDNSDPFKKRE